jgi:uncharacterized protein YbjT (DUF2867 family)
VGQLLEGGAEVVGATRRPEKARLSYPERRWVYADVDDEASLRTAMADCDVVVYLVHQMRQGAEDLAACEAAAAQRVLRAAEASKIRRIVYLGAPEPSGDPSAHLTARLETGRILRSGSVSTIELRASMIVGAESESWLMVRDLAHRLPIMVLPKWSNSLSQPVGIDDVLTALTRAISFDDDASRCFDLPGPETLSAREILQRVSGHIGIRPLMIPVPVLTPKLSSHWLRLITRANFQVAKKLVLGLRCDVVSTGDSFWTHIDLEPTPFDEVVRRALEQDDLGHRSPLERAWERAVRILSPGRRRTQDDEDQLGSTRTASVTG